MPLASADAAPAPVRSPYFDPPRGEVDATTLREVATRDAAKLETHRLNGEEPPEVEEKLSSLAYKTTMLTGLKLCPHCNERVGVMSKCTAKGVYHIDLLGIS